MPLLGAHARALLKGAVINAENHNRLAEEDKCWRSHNKKEEKSKRSRPVEKQVSVTKIKTHSSDKWVRFYYSTLNNTLVKFLNLQPDSFKGGVLENRHPKR
jgi:hypothetical protein